MSLIKEIAMFSIGTISVSGAVAYIAKAIINNWINKDIERYKIELNRLSLEHQIKFSKLHNDRAEVIKNLYSKLDDLKLKLEIVLDKNSYSVFDNQDELYIILDFLDYYAKNKIYFNRDICFNFEEIEAIMGILQGLGFMTESTTTLDEKAVELINMLIKEEIPKLKATLEDEFRKLLGVE